MSKTINIVLVALALMLSQNAFAQLQVFACEPEWGALAQTLGGDAVKVTTATTGLQDPHRIQARPSLIAAARHADLLVCTGAELEIGWLPLLLQKSGNSHIQPGQPGHFLAADVVDLLDVPDNLDRSEGDIHADGNPHIQTDPRRIAEVARALAARMASLDPAQGDAYKQRLAAFAARWHKAMARWGRQAAPLRGANIIVQHKSWVYLEDWLGLNELAALEPKPGVPPTTGQLAKLLVLVKQKPVLAIVRAAYQSPKASQWLAAKSGIPAVTLPFTVGGNECARDLFSLFDDTIERLLAAQRP